MAKDKSGAELKPGDKVLIRGTVKDVGTDEEYANLIVTTDEVMFPTQYGTNLTLNGGQVERQGDAPKATKSTATPAPPADDVEAPKAG